MKTYRGKYPTRIESVWSERIEKNGRTGTIYRARTNDGKVYLVIPRPGAINPPSPGEDIRHLENSDAIFQFQSTKRRAA